MVGGGERDNVNAYGGDYVGWTKVTGKGATQN